MSSLANTVTAANADTESDRSAASAELPPAPPLQPAQYYVVPWALTKSGGEPISLKCLYFDESGRMVDSQPMASPNAFFRFTQGGPDTVPALPMPPDPVDVSLFSAVAKTLTTSCQLNNSFLATERDGATSVVLPVAPASTRGVILVFRYPASGDVRGLVATSDPEIKNSSDTSDHRV